MQDRATYNREPAPKRDLLKECLMPAMGTVGCIDDRDFMDFVIDIEGLDEVLVNYQEKGPQLLGASLAPLPLLVEIAIETGEEIDRNFLIDVVFAAHKARDMKVTVHMDDHHGELKPEEILAMIKKVMSGNRKVKIPGCGFAGLLASKDNPLGLSPQAAEFFQENDDLVEEYVRRGVRLIVLKGNHADKGQGNAFAVRNDRPRQTLDTRKAIEQGAQAYNHDDWFLDELMQRCAEVLDGAGKGAWAQRLRERYQELNNEWLNITTNILAGMDAVAI